MAGSMTGMTEEEYRNMMIAGGRSVEGNRYIGENGSAQAQTSPKAQPGNSPAQPGRNFNWGQIPII
jgi:protocatechuate 4,5-dioxygenase alpha chain